MKEKKESIDEEDIESIPGIGEVTAEKLREAGYRDLKKLAGASARELTGVTGISESVAQKIIQYCFNLADAGFASGKELLKRREKIFRIKTGAENFDNLLNGGFESGSITEVFSAWGGGKTSIAHVLAINALDIDEKGKPLGHTVWIDTEMTFRPERIKEICEARGLDFNKILSHIHVARAFNVDHQILCANKIESLIQEEKLNVRLVVVDSLMAHFRSSYLGRGSLAERQQRLNKHMHDLMRSSAVNNFCVFVTNQVIRRDAK